MKVILIAMLVLMFGGCNAIFQYATIDYYRVTIDSKERITTGSGDSLSHKYLIFTDSRTFENTDSLWHWKWNSSDLHGKLKKGKHYKIKTYGWRVPFFHGMKTLLAQKKYNPAVICASLRGSN